MLPIYCAVYGANRIKFFSGGERLPPLTLKKKYIACREILTRECVTNRIEFVKI